MNQYEELLRPLKNYHILNSYVVMSHLFLKNTKEANRIIQNDFDDVPDYYKMMNRIMYAISFFIDEEVELALNELKNADALVKNEKIGNSKIYLEDIKVFLAYFSDKFSHIKIPQDRLKQLKLKAQALLDSYEDELKEPYQIWLLNEINKDLDKF